MTACKICRRSLEVAGIIGYVSLTPYCSLECYKADLRKSGYTKPDGMKTPQQIELQKTQEGSCVFLNPNQ